MTKLLIAVLLLLPASPFLQEDESQQAVRLAIAKRYDEALAVLHPLLARNPDDAQIYYLIGLCYLQLKDLERSVRYLEASVANRPQFPKPYLWLANAYLMQEKPEKAREIVTQGLKRFPRHEPLLQLQEGIRSQESGIRKKEGGDRQVVG